MKIIISEVISKQELRDFLHTCVRTNRWERAIAILNNQNKLRPRCSVLLSVKGLLPLLLCKNPSCVTNLILQTRNFIQAYEERVLLHACSMSGTRSSPPGKPYQGYVNHATMCGWISSLCSYLLFSLSYICPDQALGLACRLQNHYQHFGLKTSPCQISLQFALLRSLDTNCSPKEVTRMLQSFPSERKLLTVALLRHYYQNNNVVETMAFFNDAKMMKYVTSTHYVYLGAIARRREYWIEASELILEHSEKEEISRCPPLACTLARTLYKGGNWNDALKILVTPFQGTVEKFLKALHYTSSASFDGAPLALGAPPSDPIHLHLRNMLRDALLICNRMNQNILAKKLKIRAQNLRVLASKRVLRNNEQ